MARRQPDGSKVRHIESEEDRQTPRRRGPRRASSPRPPAIWGQVIQERKRHGIFDFVKNAGKSIFGSGADAAEADAAKAIAKEIGDPSLADKIKVEVDGETVKITGDVPDQETREKIIVAAGNVEGISKVDEDIKTEDDTPEGSFHTVAKGDTLWAIAEKAYGDGSKYMAIFEANKPMLSHPDRIYPGQKLRIPAQKADA